MSLLDDARGKTLVRGPKCDTCLFLRAHPDIAGELQEALDTEGLHATAIERALKDRGYRLSYQSLARHRRGICVPR